MKTYEVKIYKGIIVTLDRVTAESQHKAIMQVLEFYGIEHDFRVVCKVVEND